MLSYIEVDGTRIEFINGKPSTQRQKQKARRLQEDYLYEEQFIIDELKRRNFIYQVSSIYALIKRNIPNVFLSRELFRGLGWFFSIQFNLPFHREYYRRKDSCIFWLQLHYGEIKDFLSQHSFIIKYDDSEFRFSI